MKELAAVVNHSEIRVDSQVREPWQILSRPSDDVDTLEPVIYIPFKLNNLLCINKVFKECNQKLNQGAHIVGYFETLEQRRKRLCHGKRKFIRILKVYCDFLWRRVAPKLPILRKLDERFHLVRNRSFSLCEIWGRLKFCGFEVIESMEDSKYYYFKAKKVGLPREGNPKYGILIRLPRIGKDGKTFHIYKLRTMHSYAQYLHDDMLNNNGLNNLGKIKEDFRIPDWGRVLRRWWADEVPQLINLLKGDIRLVGVRALSLAMYNTYPDNLKKERTRMKPGLIPPYYADLPKSIKEVYDSEWRYLNRHKEHPWRTDVEYFFKAFYNIVFKGARSS